MSPRELAFTGVIFDLDGTLTEPDAIDFARMRRRIGMPESGSILHWIDDHAGSESEAEEMRAVVWEEEALALDRMALGEGFADLVDVLKNADAAVPTAICTRNSTEAIEAFDALLARSGFPPQRDLFPVAVARDHHSQRLGRALQNKPSPEPAHEILHAWGLVDRYPVYAGHESEAPRYPELLFVGDGRDDLLSGRRAGTSAAWMDHDAGNVPSVATHAFRNLSECAAVLAGA
jgi:phosphoglycolate phosphatase-like HAD superfamily hydrolase